MQYKNRLSAGCGCSSITKPINTPDGVKPENTTNNTVVIQKPITNTTAQNPCSLGLAEVVITNDNVIVTMDDCTYKIASNTIVKDLRVKEEVSSKTSPVITSITLVKEKAIVMLNDNTFLEADKSVVDESLNTDIQTLDFINDVKSKVESLETKMSTIQNGLVEIKNAHNEVTHKAFNSTFNLGE